MLVSRVLLVKPVALLAHTPPTPDPQEVSVATFIHHQPPSPGERRAPEAPFKSAGCLHPLRDCLALRRHESSFLPQARRHFWVFWKPGCPAFPFDSLSWTAPLGHFAQFNSCFFLSSPSFSLTLFGRRERRRPSEEIELATSALYGRGARGRFRTGAPLRVQTSELCPCGGWPVRLLGDLEAGTLTSWSGPHPLPFA